MLAGLRRILAISEGESLPRPVGPISVAVVILAMLVFVEQFIEMGVVRYRIYRAGVDTGLFTQVLSSATTGFHSTQEGGVNHLAVHFSPILFAVAPLVSLTHSSLTLIVVQTLAVAATAPAIYLLARPRIGPLLAAGCACIVLLYPPLAGVTFTDFHEAAFEPAAIAWLFWAVDAGRLRVAVVLAVVALCIKEDVAPGLAFSGLIGAFWFRSRGDRVRARTCAVVSVLAVVIVAIYFAVVQPRIGGGVGYGAVHFYTDPSGANGSAALWARFLYLVKIMTPLVWVPLLSPAFIFVLPGLLETMGSHLSITLSLETHYAAVWCGYMLAAFVLAVAFVYRFSRLAALLVVTLSIGSSYGWLITGDTIARWYYLYRTPNERDARLDRLLTSLPPDAGVSAPDRIFAHLGFDPNATVVLGRTYAVVDFKETDMSELWNRNAAALRTPKDAGYRLVSERDGIALFEHL